MNIGDKLYYLPYGDVSGEKPSARILEVVIHNIQNRYGSRVCYYIEDGNLCKIFEDDINKRFKFSNKVIMLEKAVKSTIESIAEYEEDLITYKDDKENYDISLDDVTFEKKLLTLLKSKLTREKNIEKKLDISS